MGTSGIVGFIIAGKRYGAYNHFDSYPEYLGQNIVKFIVNLSPDEWDEMKVLLEKLTWIPNHNVPVPAELKKHYVALGYGDKDVKDWTAEGWWRLLMRVQGVRCLYELQKGDLKHLVDWRFGQGNWSYYLDFENRTLETWKGEDLLDTVGFANLCDLGKKYMERVMKLVRLEQENTSSSTS